MPEIHWTSPEFEYRHKTISWYWISMGIATLVLGIAIWQKNFLFAVFIVIAEILLLVWAQREPVAVNFSLTEKGLTIGGQKFYASNELRCFAVDKMSLHDSEWPEIVVHFHNRIRPNIRIHVPKVQLPEIQKVLKLKMPEIEFEQSMLDALEKFFRF